MTSGSFKQNLRYDSKVQFLHLTEFLLLLVYISLNTIPGCFFFSMFSLHWYLSPHFQLQLHFALRNSLSSFQGNSQTRHSAVWILSRSNFCITSWKVFSLIKGLEQNIIFVHPCIDFNSIFLLQFLPFIWNIPEQSCNITYLSHLGSINTSETAIEVIFAANHYFRNGVTVLTNLQWGISFHADGVIYLLVY